MGGAAAVGVHDDLPAGQARIRRGTALDEAAGGIDIVLGVLIQHVGGDDHPDDLLDHVLADLLQGDVRVVLGGDDHGVHPDRAVVLVILHRDLALAVRPHVGHQAGLADQGHLLAQLLGQRQGQGHQLGGLVAGVAEHHALVASALAQLGVATLVLQGLIDAHGDVGRLLVDGSDDAAGVAVEAVLAAVIADVPDHIPGDLVDVHIAAGGDLAHDVDQAGAGRGLTGYTAHRVLGQDGVQNGVGNLVADLVGMTFGHGFRGKKIMSCHICTPSVLPSQDAKKTARFDDETRRKTVFPRSSSVGIRRIWHLTKQVAVVSLGRSLRHS